MFEVSKTILGRDLFLFSEAVAEVLQARVSERGHLLLARGAELRRGRYRTEAEAEGEGYVLVAWQIGSSVLENGCSRAYRGVVSQIVFGIRAGV